MAYNIAPWLFKHRKCDKNDLYLLNMFHVLLSKKHADLTANPHLFTSCKV